MPADMSLSQSLGGLRIANPDDEAVGSPDEASPPATAMGSEERRPPPSSHSSGSTVTGRGVPGLLPTLSHQSLEQQGGLGLGFDPDTFDVQPPARSATAEEWGRGSPAVLQHSSSRSPVSSQGHVYEGGAGGPRKRLSHRTSMPLDYQAQQQMQYSAYGPGPGPGYGHGPGGMGMRPSGMQGAAIRPGSGMYSQPNASSSSGLSQASYDYRVGLGSSDGSASGLARSSSRGSRQAYGAAPSRESSRNYRSGSQPMNNGGNGPLPPRRNSRRMRGPGPGPGLNGMYENSPEGSYMGSAPMPKNAEEWRDRGAAVTTKKEIDASGQQSQRIIKKGVKDFNFGRTLGEGSYSTVLAATDRQNLKEYAIKVLDKRHIIKEKKVKYVNIERDTLNRLTEHPGVVRLYYTFQDERSLYFVLDLASGGELLGVLKKMGSFDNECTRFYSAEILDSIAYMHSRGVIHRDLKPENVLLDRDMHVKITDFGTAKILSMGQQSNGSKPDISGVTPGDPTDGIDAQADRAVSFVGTAEYVSPELLRDKNACKASDLWAFGCIVYQLLAGRPPFKAANEYLTFQKILGLEYSFPDGFPEVARDLVERLLVLDPAKRLPVEHIRNHRFFDGVIWGKSLWKQKAPRLKAYVPPPAAPIKLGSSVPGNGHSPSDTGLQYGQMSSGSQSGQQTQPPTPRPQLRGITELPPPSQLDIEWSPVLTHPNERILKLGNLVVNTSTQPHTPGEPGTPSEKPKFSRFFSGNTTKKRERLVLITSSARVILAAEGGKDKKAKMDLNLLSAGCQWKSFVDAKGLTAWSIDTRDKHLLFEDPRATTSDPAGSKYSTQEWLDSLESAREFALSQQSSHTSYSGESPLLANGVGESPTAGEDAAMPLRERGMLRKTEDGERIVGGPGAGGRKRFSKRHSKSGLAAVF